MFQVKGKIILTWAVKVSIMDVNAKIKELAKVRGWNEYRVVKETGLPPSTVANIYHRGTVPSIVTLERVCEAFGITMSQFFGDGRTVHLTPELSDLLERWSRLSLNQRQAVLALLQCMDER